MGNQQSNERQKNYKVYKITEKSVCNDYIRCYLNDYVPYSNGNYKHIDIVKIPTFLSIGASLAGADTGPSLCEGSHIAIDINMTCDCSSGHEFHPTSVKGVVFSGSLPGEGGFQGNIGEIAEARERYARASE